MDMTISDMKKEMNFVSIQLNDKIKKNRRLKKTCKTCGGEYQRSNKWNHKQTKYHQKISQMNRKLLALLHNNIQNT
jgi:hypothetical protein